MVIQKMKRSFIFALFVALSTPLLIERTLRADDSPSPPSASAEKLFNGTDLSGWKGLESLWNVRDGVIVGETSEKAPIQANTFLIWQGGELGDFEFRCQVRVKGNNSGVQYRSELVDADQLALAGYQADLHPKSNYMGMMYGEKTGRGIIATGGQRVSIGADSQTKVTAQIQPLTDVSVEQWNELRIVAVGNRMIHQVNGITTVDVLDEHPDAKASGLLGLQLHKGPAMKAEFRDLELTRLGGDAAKKVLLSTIASTKVSSGDSPVPAKNKTSKPNKPSKKASASSWLMKSPVPQWIWSDRSSPNQRVWFRHSFRLPSEVKSAALYASCDNQMELFINGHDAGRSTAWEAPIQTDVTKWLKSGSNMITIAGRNEGGIAALVAKLSIEFRDGKTRTVGTGTHWKLSEQESKDWKKPEFDDKTWTAAKSVGKLGVQPWGVPGQNGGNRSSKSSPLDVEDIFTKPGFVVERIYTAKKEEGSWVSMTTDPQGRLYVCDQAKAGLYRLTLRPGKEPLMEKVSVGSLASLSSAQGLEWAFDSLWFHTNGGHLVRVSDSDGDDMLDTTESFPGGTGGGEHGNHAVMKTADGTKLYLDGGNHAPLAEHETSRVPTWSEGLLLPRMWDAKGHARGRMAPGGWVTELDPATKEQTVHSIGYRNQYDIALNRHGDVFAYDADMEWDFGLPWYRPTRICFAASGSDYGWRSGSGKWPTYYEDTLPPVVDIGPGSPTGLLSGTGAAFPTQYQDAIYAFDWTYGTVYAIHMVPDGAGYRGKAEPFVYGSPLPLTDAVIGLDGAMYFAVGGRGTATSLYRVSYEGDASTEPPTRIDAACQEARKQRRALEAFHGNQDPHAIATAWPFLSSPDRFLRHAARVAIESQPVAEWSSRVSNETDSQARITASVALARMGQPEHRPELISGLLGIDVSSLSASQTLGMLRAYALTFIEAGQPSEDERVAVIEQLSDQLPHENADVNTELIRVLTYLRDPSVIGKTLSLIENRADPELPPWSELAQRNDRYGSAINRMLNSHPPTRELSYAFMLRNVRKGWTLEQRRTYFTFMNEAAKRSGGASYAGYLTRIRDEALATCNDAERIALNDLTGEDFDPKPDFPISEPVGPGKKWTLEQVLAAGKGKKNFENGRSLYFSAKCAACHRLQGLGGAIGPDLTSVRNKFDDRYLAEAIVEPSKNISDQYGSSRVLTADGDVLTGLVVEQDNGDLLVYPVDENAKSIRVAADDIEQIDASKLSQMPAGLLDRLNAEEVRDLMAYIMSGGDPNDKVYGRK